ncbi:MAG TPA: HAMP domain-containing sensor histidine kinase [Sedimentisphaerales bacterium]|nr:HAMP domain-containing sensor histidine kinase [Sedimentisphaerales bacterium]HRS12030.1 HAMP domain-containing sensor histidine kinase [Sedimentisphaerales bacterium]HRV48537.1 HAMP domain-containing sensor histidine kinase [Sedimentisphaerales bacterium]
MASIIDKRLALHQRLAKKEQEYNTLKLQNVQLQALANLGSATSMIAHEINNLLTPLANYAALAAKNPHDTDLVAKVLDKTVRNCERASKIMVSMLAMANGRPQEKHRAALRALVDDVFTCLCRDFNKDGITVRIEVPETVEIVCVPVQIQQVFMNLILNARDAMLPGGGLLTISACEDGVQVHIAVTDTGRGIPSGDLDSIFEPFFTTKAGQEGPATYSGSGVGLAFCKRVVNAHGGEISAESCPGRGTTFHVRLPKSSS